MEGISDKASMPAFEACIATDPESCTTVSTATRTSSTIGQSMSGALHRKVAKRTYPWLLALAEAEPVASAMPIDEDGDIQVPIAKKITDEAARICSAKITSPDAEEATLPQPDASAAAGAPSSESTFENEVELTIRVVKPTPIIHGSGDKCRKKELAALVAMAPTQTTNTNWHTSNGESAWYPSISAYSLTGEEDEKARKNAVETDNGKKFGGITELVSDRRSAVDPSSNHTNERTGKWTAKEDSKLKSAVEMHGDENWEAANRCKGKNWVIVSALVPGRTRKQCRDRWKYLVETSINRAAGRTGKWTMYEDDKLKDLVQTHGSKNNWDAIAALVSGRSRSQCMHRWQSGLRTSIDRMTNRTGKWTKVEDAMLVCAVEKHDDKNWEAIASMVLFRSKVQCWNRWNNPGFHNSSYKAIERTGKLTVDEDKKLKDAVQMHNGNHGDAVASLVPGRQTMLE